MRMMVGLTSLGLLLGVAVGCGKSSDKSPQSANVTAETMAPLVEGIPEDQAVAAESLELMFSLSDDLAALGYALQGFECRFAVDKDFVPCGTDKFHLTGLEPGQSYEIEVRAVVRRLADGVEIRTGSVSASFQVAEMPNHKVRGGLGHSLVLGNSYKVDVPSGMHVTEYSSSKTVGVLSYHRILPESDPYYLNNFQCNRSWDSLVASLSPEGDPLMYCHSTPTRQAYKDEHEYRLAHNNVELATDTRYVKATNQERLSIAVFDADHEFMNSRSRFWNSCQNSERNFIRVPMVENFFLGRAPEEVNFWYCDTYQPDIDGTPVLWRVGAFFSPDVLDWECGNCMEPRSVEAVYMVRANTDIFLPATFARISQQRFMDVIEKLTP